MELAVQSYVDRETYPCISDIISFRLNKCAPIDDRSVFLYVPGVRTMIRESPSLRDLLRRLAIETLLVPRVMNPHCEASGIDRAKRFTLVVVIRAKVRTWIQGCFRLSVGSPQLQEAA
jgi:hypothetical protein